MRRPIVVIGAVTIVAIVGLFGLLGPVNLGFDRDGAPRNLTSRAEYQRLSEASRTPRRCLPESCPEQLRAAASAIEALPPPHERFVTARRTNVASIRADAAFLAATRDGRSEEIPALRAASMAANKVAELAAIDAGLTSRATIDREMFGTDLGS
jgi:hypothetical protein